MVKVLGYKVNNFCKIITDEFEKRSRIVIRYDDFLLKSFGKQEMEDYPRTARIGKDIESLLQHDTSPKRVMSIKTPPTWNNIPFWTQRANKSIKLTLGYKNGDSRFPEVLTLDDNGAHVILAGSTGSGKSVTLNAILFSVLLNYAPWEVEIHLLDAKIATFAPYADYNIPHIKSVGATEDTDYIISALEHIKQQMSLRNELFGKFGVEKLEDFEKKTGLTLPRQLIIVDEFQTLFTNAGRKADKVKELFQQFAKLGRSTGFHLICCSQEPDGLPDTTMKNMTNRMILMCDGSVSTKMIGNDEGNTLKSLPKGRLILNRNPFEPRNKKYNVHVQVPYLDDDTRYKFINLVQLLAKSCNYETVTSFYKETDIIREDEFKEKLRNSPIEDGLFYLGEASFYTDDPDKMCKIRLKREGADNIAIYSTGDDTLRNLLVLKYNMELHPEYENIVLYYSEGIVSDVDFSTITNKILRIKNSKERNYINSINQVYLRQLLFDIDSKVFGTKQFVPSKFGIEGAEYLRKHLLKRMPNYIDNSTNRKRLEAMCDIIITADYENIFPFQKKVSNFDINELNYAVLVMSTYQKLNLADTKLELSMLPKLFIWLVGMDNIRGIGSDSNFKDQDNLNKVMAMGPELNVRFIFQMSKTDGVTKMKNYVRFIMGNSFGTREQSFFGIADAYPNTISNKQGLIYDTLNKDEMLKYKKLYLKGESM